MNAGVSTDPAARWSRPTRAAPSRAVISNRRRSGSARTTRKPRGLLLLRFPVHGLADLNAMRLALRRLRDAHLEHALVEAGADLVGVDVLRQRQRPREAAIGPLDAVEAVR